MTERLTNPDEIMLEDVKLFHLENMSSQHLWVAAYCEDGRIFHLNIFAKGDRLQYYWSDETPDELAQDPSIGAPDAL
jgi:hypothetical protein